MKISRDKAEKKLDGENKKNIRAKRQKKNITNFLCFPKFCKIAFWPKKNNGNIIIFKPIAVSLFTDRSHSNKPTLCGGKDATMPANCKFRELKMKRLMQKFALAP